MALAGEQEMKARTQEMRAKVVEAEAEVPMAMAQALREGKLGVMDYYNSMYFRALVKVDWDNNQVSVAYADCPSGMNNLIWIWHIYAIG